MIPHFPSPRAGGRRNSSGSLPEILLVVLLSSALYSCASYKARIGVSAESIRDLAQSSQVRFEEIAGTSQVSEIVATASVGVSEQKDIQGLAKGVQLDLHGVEDAIPWYGRVLSLVSWALIIVGIVAILWTTGLGRLIKAFFWSLGLFIPKRAMREAAMDLKESVTGRESVAAKRASDPAYEAARRKLKGSVT